MKHLITISTLALILMAGLAEAAPQNKTVRCDVSVRKGDVTICKGSTTYNFTSDGPSWNYTISLRAPSAHCSDVRYTVLNRAGRTLGRTDWLSAGQSAGVNIPSQPRGAQSVVITADGRVGGCNDGRMKSWGVIVDAERWG